jgi:alkylation response protein AidB-like acyl-CoA dehydrogenase
MKRKIFDAEHEQLRETTKQYIEREIAPNAEKWERDRIVDRSAYLAAGKYGLIGFNMPEEYGGGGSEDFRFNAVINEELAKWGSVVPALSLQNDVRRTVLQDAGQRRAERPLATRHHQRRDHRRDRHDRTGRGQRFGRHPHLGGA